MTMDRRFATPLVIVLAAVILSGCRDTPLAVNVNSNISPVAYAGDPQTIAYNGSPVTVTLTASGSHDPDGEIVHYRWTSGNNADGGMGPGGPDPDDVVAPAVTLDAGVWFFTLFVADNDNGISLPSTVTITVGSAASPEALMCSEDALQTIPEDCRLCVCGISDMCRTAIAGCNQACWDFYTCVQNKCGEFVNMDETALANCVRANCSAFFGGVGGYMPLDPCLNRGPCAETCAASVSM
jgi:hypothetical protein